MKSCHPFGVLTEHFMPFFYNYGTPLGFVLWFVSTPLERANLSMGVAIQRPERRIGSRWAGLRERAPIFAYQIFLSRLIKDQQPDKPVFYT